MSSRIMVTGSRGWTERTLIRMALSPFILGGDQEATLVHGDARGADQLTAEIAEGLGFAIEAHPADWGAEPRKGGILRNVAMLSSGIDHVVALHLNNSRGTAHAVAEAIRRGIPVTRFLHNRAPRGTAMSSRPTDGAPVGMSGSLGILPGGFFAQLLAVPAGPTDKEKP